MKKVYFLLLLLLFLFLFISGCSKDLSKMNEHNFKDYKCDYNIEGEVTIAKLLSFPEYKGKDGLLCVLHNGRLETKAYVPLKNGVADGNVITYLDDDILFILSVWEVKNGVVDGMFKTYYSNENVEEEGYYRNNRSYGKWTSYNEDGSVDMVKDYGK